MRSDNSPSQTGIEKTLEVKRTFLSRDFSLALMSYSLVVLSVAVFYLFPLFLDTFHPTKSQVGLIMGVHSVMAIVIRPLFGRILDQKGGRTVSFIGILVMIAALPGYHFVGSAGILAFLLRALSGAGWGIATMGTMAMCADLAPLDRMAHSLGIIGVGGIITGAIGPTLAEETVRIYSFGAVFNLSIALLIVALLCVLATKNIPHPQGNIQSSRIRSLQKHSLSILVIIAAMPIIHGAARGTVINFIALYGTSIGFTRISPFFIAFSVAATLTRVGIGDFSDRYGRKQVIFPAASIIALNLFWIAAIHSYGLFILNGFIAGLGQGLIFPALSAYIIDFWGHENKGFALGLYLSLFDVGMGLGSPIFGWISDMAGYSWMYIIAGTLLLTWTIVFSIKAPRVQPAKSFLK
jgi:MFS family permease